MKKRILALLLTVVLVVSCLPTMVFAAEPGGSPRAWIEGYADGSTSNFRSSQMLAVKTDGFSDKAKLSYHYYSNTTKRSFGIFNYGFLLSWPAVKLKEKPASTSGPFGFIGAIANVINCLEVLYVDDAESESPYFAVSDTPAIDMKIRIVVTDTNKKSSTYNQSVELNVGPFQKADLTKDINVPYAMFVGETKSVPEILLSSGVGHIYPEAEECATINSLKIENVDAGTVTVTDAPSDFDKYINMKVSANQTGLAKMSISLSKAESCTYQPGLTGVGNNYIRVFKKPIATPVDDGFDLTNTEKGVTYTIGSQSKICTEDDETLSFRGLAGDCEYEIFCSVQLPNVMKARTSITAHTLAPYNVNFSVAEHPGVTNLPESREASRSGLDKAEEPEHPYAPGYVFGDWYADSTFTTLYDFESLVTSDLTLKGKWTPLKHTTVVSLTLNNKAYSGRTVELYQDYQKKYTLTETGTAGTYQLEDAVETGVYDIYVDGNSVYSTIEVAGRKNEKDLTPAQLSALISGEKSTASVAMVPLKTQCLLDGEGANIGEVYYRDEMGNHLVAQYVEDADGKYYYAPTSVTDPRVQDIFANGTDSDRQGANDASKDISVASPSKVLNFYRMSLVIDIDDAEWTSSNVVLRDRDGNFVAQLSPEAYNSTDGTRTFSAVMPKDEKATPDEYTVFLDGANTGIVLTATESGHSETACAYKAAVSVKKNGEAWNDAVVLLSNADYNYTLFKGTDGTYETALLYDANDEKPYSVSVNAAIDSADSKLSSTSRQLDMDFYSVEFYSYKKGSKDGVYTLDNARPYREQTVRAGSSAMEVAEPYVEGLTFRCFAKEAWTLGETPVTAYDFDTAVNAQLTLYAHFENPEININGFVKSDASGAVSSTGDCFILPNLTISGFDEGEAIKSILITVSNVEGVSFPSKDGVTVNSKSGSHAITFADKVSMAEAQVYLRAAVFKPVQEKNINLNITVSDGVIGASSDTTFTQKQITETWTKLSSVSGYNNRTTKGLTLSSGNYYADASVTIKNTSAGGSGLRISGTVKLYIPQNVTVTCNGGAGSGQTGGGAGVYLPSGSNLYLYGAGTLNANGGKAGNGEKGENGKDSIFRVSLESYVTESGRGGNSGGGAGAGIGTNGASGVDGAAPTGSYSSTYKGQTGIYIPDKTDIPGMKGNSGNNGNKAADAGNVYTNGVTVNPVGGGAGDSVSDKSSSGGYDTHKWNQFWTAGSSGGGGNGKPGRAGNNVGPGGSSGGSGGSGGSGAIIWTSGSATWNAIGGRGGNGDESGEKGTKSNDSVGGDGGNGGTTPANKTAKSVQPCAALTGYTVKFVGAQGSPAPTSYALNSKNIVVNVPDYTPESGKFFLGWRVSTYGNNVNGQSDSKPLTTAETKLYQPGESITLAELTYGNIELKPVTIAIAGKTDTDKLSIQKTVFAPSAPPVDYYNYTVKTTLNGTAADIGTLVLKPETGDSITLGGNGSGTYSLTNEVYTTYRIYVNNEDSGVTVAEGTPAEVQARLITVTTKLNGSASAVPGDVTLVSESASLSSVPVLSGGEFTGTYKIQKLSKDMPSDTEFTVYVAGENTGIKVKAGDDISADYYVAEVTVQGNITADNVILKNSAAGEILLGKTGSIYCGTHLADETAVYDVYVNGQPAGKTVKFTSSDRAVTVTGNVLTINIRVNGEISDATGCVPTYRGIVPEKTSEGTYQIQVFGEASPAVLDGKQKSFTDEKCVFDFYTVAYDGNGATAGTAPTDSIYYIEGSRPVVSFANSLVKEGCQQNGWSISGDSTGAVYYAGDMLPEISGTLTLNAVWKQLSDYPLVIVMGDEVLYGDSDTLRKMITDRNYPEEGDGTPGLTIIVQENTELPDNLYLGPKDEMIIRFPAAVETDNLTNEGKITVEQGAELLISGTLKNQGELENNGEIVVEQNALLLNEEDGIVMNSGNLEIKENAEAINKGELANNEDGTLQIDNGGSFTNSEDGNVDNDGELIVNGAMENDGTIGNSGSVKSTTTPGGSIDNNNVIDSSKGGSIDLPIENEGGIVVGGTLEGNGSIDGGAMMGMDTTEASPDAVKNVKNSLEGKSSVPAPGGELTSTLTQDAVDDVFGIGNAELVTDEQGNPALDVNGNYVVAIKNGVELENPIKVPTGAAVTFELAGNKIEGPDGESAIIVSDGTLDIHDSIGGGGIFGGMGTTENGGSGDGGNGIEVLRNGCLSVNENVNVGGGPGVASGKGGNGIVINLDPDGTGEVYINGKISGGNGGSDMEETPGSGGTAVEIITAPEEKVVLGSDNEMDGGEGGQNSNGEKGEQGNDSEIAPEAERSVYRETITNDDNVEIVLVNTLYATGETQEQIIQVKVNDVPVPETDYTISKNTGAAAGEYVLKITFKTEIDESKPYSILAGNHYFSKFEVYLNPVDAPAISEACTIDYINETITPKTGYEMSLSSGDGFEYAMLTGSTALDFNKTYYLRKAGDELHETSSETAYTPVRPTVPSTPEEVKRTDDAVSVGYISGQEYSIDGGITWQENAVFTGLAPDTEYRIVSRVKVTEYSYESNISDAAILRTKNSAPAAPAVGPSDVTVTDSDAALPVNGDPNSYEYSLDGISWTENNSVTGLAPATEYTFYVREKETDTSMPSEAKSITAYTAEKTPEKGEGYTLDVREKTITVEPGYEISISDDPFEALTLTDQVLPVELDKTYYIRKAGGEKVPASEALSFITKEDVCTHADADNDHICDICNETVSEHADADNDHICDMCLMRLSDHTDSNRDHYCDLCSIKMSDHADSNRDHYCDLCGIKLSDHYDSNKDYSCDLCGYIYPEKEEEDSDETNVLNPDKDNRITTDDVNEVIDAVKESGEKELVISIADKTVSEQGRENMAADGTDGKTGDGPQSGSDGKTEGGNDEVTVTEKLSLDEAAIKTLAENDGIDSVTIQTDVADIKLSAACIDSINSQADGDITISMTKTVKKGSGADDESDPDADMVIYEFSIIDAAGNEITSLDGKKIKITVLVPEDIEGTAPAVVLPDGKGGYSTLKGTVNSDGTITFETKKLDEIIIMDKADAENMIQEAEQKSSNVISPDDENTVDSGAVKKMISKLEENGKKTLVISTADKTVSEQGRENKAAAGSDEKTGDGPDTAVMTEELCLEKAAIKALAKADGINSVTIQTDVADIKLSAACIDSLKSSAKGDVTLSVSRTVKEAGSESGKEQSEKGSADEKVYYNFSLTDEKGNEITTLDRKKIKITVPVPVELQDKDPVCVFSDGKGHYSPVKGKVNKDGTITFETNYLAEIVIMSQNDADDSYNYIHDMQTLNVYVKDSTDTTITIEWGEYPYADGFIVYGGYCNEGDKKYKTEKLATIKDPSATAYTISGLESGQYYKFKVTAYRSVNGKYGIVKSYLVHARTSENGKNGNDSVDIEINNISRNKLTLKKKDKYQIDADQYNPDGKKFRHVGVRYETSDTSVAVVTEDGMIRAVGKGKCSIYVYAENGTRKEITVKVK